MSEINTIESSEHEAQGQPRKRWLRGRRLIAVAAVPVVLGGAVAVAVGLTAGLSGSGAPATPAAQLSADGFPVTMDMNHQQLLGLLNASGSTSSTDAQLAGSMFSTGAMGMKNGQGEVVLEMTDSGKSLLTNPTMMNDFKAGFGQSGTVKVIGNFLVIDGSMNN